MEVFDEVRLGSHGIDVGRLWVGYVLKVHGLGTGVCLVGGVRGGRGVGDWCKPESRWLVSLGFKDNVAGDGVQDSCTFYGESGVKPCIAKLSYGE